MTLQRRGNAEPHLNFYLYHNDIYNNIKIKTIIYFVFTILQSLIQFSNNILQPTIMWTFISLHTYINYYFIFSYRSFSYNRMAKQMPIYYNNK